MESNQDIPECLESFKPQMDPNAPLFEDDDDDDEDENNSPTIAPPSSVSKGATWDAGDNSVVFQGDGLRTFHSPQTHCFSF
jgi:hypothetical protein